MKTLLNVFEGFFEWEPSNMPCINTKNISHELKIDPTIKSIAHNNKMMDLWDAKRLSVRPKTTKSWLRQRYSLQ